MFVLWSLCARWIASAKARAKTVFGHLKYRWEFKQKWLEWTLNDSRQTLSVVFRKSHKGRRPSRIAIFLPVVRNVINDKTSGYLLGDQIHQDAERKTEDGFVRLKYKWVCLRRFVYSFIYSIVFCIKTTSSNVSLYRIDLTCVTNRLRIVSKRLVSKRLCIETTGFCFEESKSVTNDPTKLFSLFLV